jgi:hypothetical protein
VYGPPLPGEPAAPGGAVASELPNASPGDAPPEAPTEAVQTIGRQLPAAALDQLVARSRQSNVDAPASPAERSPSGEEVAPGGEARSRPGVAALTNGSTLRTSLPATGRGLRQRKGSGATGAGTGTGTGNGTGTAGAAAGSPSQLALPDAGDEGDATRLFAPVTQPARQTFGGVRPSGYDGGRENRGDVTSGGAEPPARGDLSLQPSLLDDQDAGSRDEIAVEAEVAGVEREPAGVVSPGETVALAGSSAGAVEEQHGVDAVPIVFDFDELAEPPIAATAIRPIRGLRPPSSGRRALRVATGAAAVVALAAAGVGIWEVATKTSPDHSAAPPTKSSSKPVTSVPASRPHHVSSPGATSRKPTTKPTVPAPTTTVASSNFTPVSTTPSLAVYRVPAGSYTFKFTVSSGDCWLGAEAGSGYAWMATVYPGTPSTYSTTGTSTIRIGAPSVLSVSVNGKPVVLPKNSQPYDIEFVPSSASSASSAR